MASEKISRQEAADILGVTRQSIANYIDRGILPHTKIDKNIYLDKKDVLRFGKRHIKRFEVKMATIREYEEELNKKLAELKKRVYNVDSSLKKGGIKQLADNSLKALLMIDDEYQILTKPQRNTMKRYLGLGKENVLYMAEKYGFCSAAPAKIIAGLQLRFDHLHQIEADYEKLEQRNYKLKKENEELRNGIRMREIMEAKKVDKERLKFARKKVYKTGLSTRALNCIKAAGIETIWELAESKRKDLRKVRNMGKATLTEIEEFFEKYELGWETDVESWIRHE